jgi:2-keto-4-pentenoate hydratase/2-oxohepta-3-ene-1,7-dioic acid hydratase in catechol pathway|tara:strand:- start:74 stop:916 length:843 start_codon:yes stop_codon:yes gene_type:complete
MKLLRYRDGQLVKPGILDDAGKIRDVSLAVKDWTRTTINDEIINRIKNNDINKFPVVDANVSLAPCIGNVGKIICVGLNYSDHALETGMEVPKEPIIFMKATSAICGPNDDIIIPKNSKKTDWEVELGVIIGKKVKYISEEESEKYIAGYCIVNDLSEREFQLEHKGQWVKGKSCDSFGPIGPYLVTRDEVSDPQNLQIWLEVNGNKMQDSSTSNMVYGVNFLISYLSNFMSLHPGDIISTGTPAGVGLGMKPPVYLKPGDRMKLGIEGLGEQNQTTIAY